MSRKIIKKSYMASKVCGQWVCWHRQPRSNFCCCCCWWWGLFHLFVCLCCLSQCLLLLCTEGGPGGSLQLPNPYCALIRMNSADVQSLERVSSNFLDHTVQGNTLLSMLIPARNLNLNRLRLFYIPIYNFMLSKFWWTGVGGNTVRAKRGRVKASGVGEN